MAHLVTPFFFTFYAVIQANSKSVKIAENTFLEAKRQQYILVRQYTVYLTLIFIHIVGDILLFEANSLIYKQADCVGSLWYKPRRNPRPRVYWCPGQYGGVGLLGWSSANLI